MTAPVHPFCLFFAKYCVIVKMALLTQGWLFLLFLMGGRYGADLRGFPPPEIIVWLLRGVVGSFAIIALQLLLSLVIRSFALPILLALGGSIVGLLVTSKNIGLFWPYALMILGMNSNKTEDVMDGNLIGFFISCLAFTAGFLLLANLILAKKDVKT